MAINRIPFNRLEIINVFLGSLDSECLPFDDRILRVLSRAHQSILIFK